jgi:hypothetical protein
MMMTMMMMFITMIMIIIKWIIAKNSQDSLPPNPLTYTPKPYKGSDFPNVPYSLLSDWTENFSDRRCIGNRATYKRYMGIVGELQNSREEPGALTSDIPPYKLVAVKRLTLGLFERGDICGYVYMYSYLCIWKCLNIHTYIHIPMNRYTYIICFLIYIYTS